MMGIDFTAPWVLWALAALPILWLVLRAMPPAPSLRVFPGVALLLGLRDSETLSARTPWWILLLRMVALGAVIVALAGPQQRRGGDVVPNAGPLVIVVDGTWAQAPDWAGVQAAILSALEQARGEDVAVVQLSAAPERPVFAPAAEWREAVRAMTPTPWGRQPGWAQVLTGLDSRDALWLSDGRAGEGQEQIRDVLLAQGRLRVMTPRSVTVLRPPQMQDGTMTLKIAHLGTDTDHAVEVLGADPAGVQRVLLRQSVTPGADGGAVLDLPLELRNRVTQLRLSATPHAGAVQYLGTGLRRARVALVSGGGTPGHALLNPTHYLRQALAEQVELVEATVLGALEASPDVIMFEDVAGLLPQEVTALRTWISEGGVLVRFAGPALAREAEDEPLLPVRLRGGGGRQMGGAMSWDTPKRIAPFDPAGLFSGLVPAADVTVRAQVLAAPGPELAGRVLAQLDDGTPLVTAQDLGEGRLVLVHTTAGPDWTTLPLSGMYGPMLMRLVPSARQARSAPPRGTWALQRAIGADGRLGDVTVPVRVDAEALTGAVGPALPPGVYGATQADDGAIAVNVIGANTPLVAAQWAGAQRLSADAVAEVTSYRGVLLVGALVALLADLGLSLWITGRFVLACLILSHAMVPTGTRAEGTFDADWAIAATRDVVLGYVTTGDAQVDELSRAGLTGLGQVLTARTTVEPAAPMAVDLLRDDLSVFPMLYWPMTQGQALLSPEAALRVNAYLRAGGTILVDTRDGGDSWAGTSPEAERMRVVLAPLAIPALVAVPDTHVIGRSYYLLEQFPGRYDTDLWVEGTGGDMAVARDGVSSVVIGGGDWAAAWAVDRAGNRLLPVGRGTAGERQRETAYRFGVNLVMYVLTGNYKADQVHVPALLDRLGDTP